MGIEMGIQYQGTKKPVNAGIDYTIVWLDLLLEWSVKKGEYDNMQIFTFEVCQQVCNKVIFKQLELAIGKRGKENQSKEMRNKIKTFVQLWLWNTINYLQIIIMH